MPRIRIYEKSAPASTTETDLYTVPAGKYAIITLINIATIGAGTVQFRIGIKNGAGALVTADYLYYNAEILTKETVRDIDFSRMGGLKGGLWLDSGDRIVVYGSTAELAFQVFGEEIGVVE